MDRDHYTDWGLESISYGSRVDIEMSGSKWKADEDDDLEGGLS